MNYRRLRLALLTACAAIGGVSLALNLAYVFIAVVLAMFIVDKYLMKKAIESGEIVYDERDVYIENMINNYSFKAFIMILLAMYFMWLIDRSLSLNIVYNIPLFQTAPWFAILMIIVHTIIRSIIRWKHRV